MIPTGSEPSMKHSHARQEGSPMQRKVPTLKRNIAIGVFPHV